MVDPVTAVAVAGAATKLIGGFIGAAQARARAKYVSALYEQQANAYDYMASRKIAGEMGTSVANVTGRGITNSGTVLTRILEDNFTEQLQKQFQVQNILRQAEFSRIQGNTQAQNELMGGVAGGISSATTAATIMRDNALADKARADRLKPGATAPATTVGASGSIIGG
jgi:hypothetical protein